MATGLVFQGKTLDDAVRKGLEALGKTRAEVSITVIEEGSGGFLGIGARPYTVRISARPGGPPPEPAGDEDRGRRGARGRDRDRGERSGRGGREGRGGGRDRDRQRRGAPAGAARDERGGRGAEARGGEARPAEGRPVEGRGEGRGGEGRGGEGRGGEGRGGEGRGGEGRGGRGGRRDERGPRREEIAPRGLRDERPARREEGGHRDEPRREEFARREERPRRPDEREERVGREEGPPRHEEPVGVSAPQDRVEEGDAGGLNGGDGRRRRRRGGRGRRGRVHEREGGSESAPDMGREMGRDESHEESEVSPGAVAVASSFARGEDDDRPSRGGSEYAGHGGSSGRSGSYGDSGGGSGAGPADPAVAADAQRIAEEVLRAMGFEATVTAVAQEERAEVSISVPEHDDLLTGPKGEVRQALQHLLTLMLNRGRTDRYHVQVEVNDFWARREDELTQLARDLAAQAVESQGEAVTEYLNAQERRIIHMTLKEDPRVKTYALGTGLIKRVAVAPADFDGGPDEGDD